MTQNKPKNITVLKNAVLKIIDNKNLNVNELCNNLNINDKTFITLMNDPAASGRGIRSLSKKATFVRLYARLCTVSQPLVP